MALSAPAVGMGGSGCAPTGSICGLGPPVAAALLLRRIDALTTCKASAFAEIGMGHAADGARS